MSELISGDEEDFDADPVSESFEANWIARIFQQSATAKYLLDQNLDVEFHFFDAFNEAGQRIDENDPGELVAVVDVPADLEFEDKKHTPVEIVQGAIDGLALSEPMELPISVVAFAEVGPE